MLQLVRLEIEGFGPFADRQVVEFPQPPGVVVIYGENMRGKTTLLNAVRYAFFAEVYGRGSNRRPLRTLFNRELAALGTFKFSVTLTFRFDGDEYELHRSCRALVKDPGQDSDYEHDILLRRGADILGPQERGNALARIFPQDISRFFLFDGELLQEYEELILNESEVGPQISSAIERILGVPLLKAGRRHLIDLAAEADQQAATEASKHQQTEALGTALSQALSVREQHQRELDRLTAKQEALLKQKGEIETELSANRKYANLINERDKAQTDADDAANEQASIRVSLKRLMADAWRSLLRDPVRMAREAAQAALEARLHEMRMDLRKAAIDNEHCDVCDQDVDTAQRQRLAATLGGLPASSAEAASAASNLRELNGFDDTDHSGEIRLLTNRLNTLVVNEKSARDDVKDYDLALKDADPVAVRSTQATFAEVVDTLAITRQGIAGEKEKLVHQEAAINRIRDKLRGAQTQDLRATEARAQLLRDAATVFSDAIEAYKADLRKRVEQSATDLFLAMTTEKTDYQRLSINSDYGLTIVHRDGRPEDARSAGAEHVVALALMGALQGNAPLRGPIVMDSPFGRLDESHTSNVVGALHRMADQVVLLVYESEVGRNRVRELLGSRLIAEYELDRVSSRRTNIRKVQ